MNVSTFIFASAATLSLLKYPASMLSDIAHEMSEVSRWQPVFHRRRQQQDLIRLVGAVGLAHEEIIALLPGGEPVCLLDRCILFDNVTVGEKVRLNNCIIGPNGNVKENISVFEAAVLNISIQ